MNVNYELVLSKVLNLLEKDINEVYLRTKIDMAYQKAFTMICKYLNWTDIPIEYESAFITQILACYYNDNDLISAAKGNKTITQHSQGSRSATYRKYSAEIDPICGLTADVKAMLPLPKLKVV